MNATMLDKRVLLSAFAPRQLPSGQQVQDYAAAKPVHARIEQLASRVYTAALAEQTGCQLRVTIRRRLVASGWRLRYAGVDYQIKTVEPHRDSGYLLLMCMEEADNG